ncbi:MAG: NAD(P)H-dependent oxidoreductase [Propionibacteriaceae bacterium]|nr:NAD(P)H-dependent oxidoreductase [Propionibacteriaceae bacterium]
MKIGIVLGSIRDGRKGEEVARWVAEAAQGREVAYEVLDLKEFDVPLLTTNTHPMMAKKSYPDARVQAWSDAVDACDGYVFVTPEYNHGVPGALKNAVDSLGQEWVGKSAALVGYGSVGGVRAIENWRLVLANFSMTVVRSELNLNTFTEWSEGAFAPNERRADEVAELFAALEKTLG